MRVRVLAFASLSEALGGAEQEKQLPEGARVGDLLDALAREHPGLGARVANVAVAVDGELVGGDAPLADGVEVALLPPVSGG